MRRIALLFSILALATFAVPQTEANGTALGREMQIVVSEFPDTCPPGMDMHGTVEIEVFKGEVPTPRTITYEVFFETPLGPSVLNDGKVRLRPGTRKVVPMAFPVSEDAPEGWYAVALVATCGTDRLVVTHKFYVTGK
jgi:hypothetical protein